MIRVAAGRLESGRVDVADVASSALLQLEQAQLAANRDFMFDIGRVLLFLQDFGQDKQDRQKLNLPACTVISQGGPKGTQHAEAIAEANIMPFRIAIAEEFL